MKDKYDICLVGNWACVNYGAHLTQYALYRYLKDKGYDVLMIEKTDGEPKLSHIPPLFIENPYDENDLCKFYPDIKSMKELNNIADTFIVGSDQLWVWKLFWYAMDVYTLSFVNENKRKISYATSFGNRWTRCSERQRVFTETMLKRFQKVSIRESFGEKYSKDYFDVDAQCVIDPVFLCNKEYYLEMSEKSEIKISKPYIFCYVIWPNDRIAGLIKELAQKEDLDVICIGDAYHNRLKEWSIAIDKDLKVEDWLKLVLESSWIVTDSFHAYCFSTIFHKRIIPFGTEPCLDRMLSLADLIGRKKPLTYADIRNVTNDELFKYYDVDDVGSGLDLFIDKSKKWLEEALVSDVGIEEKKTFWDEFGADFIELKKQKALDNKIIIKDKIKSNGGSVVAFGVGFSYRRYFGEINSHLGIDLCCDNDEQKWGKEFNEKKCISPEAVSNIPSVYVVITIDDPDVVVDVKKQLESYGIKNVIWVEDYLTMIRWM